MAPILGVGIASRHEDFLHLLHGNNNYQQLPSTIINYHLSLGTRSLLQEPIYPFNVSALSRLHGLLSCARAQTFKLSHPSFSSSP